MSSLRELMCKELKTASANMVVSDAAGLMRDERIGSLLVEKDGRN